MERISTMLNKLFGNRETREMTVKRRVEMISAGGFAAGAFFGIAAVGLANTINTFFPPASTTAPSLLTSVVMSVVCLVFSAAFIQLTAWAHGRAKERLVLAEPSAVQQG